jgi:hypothetical protein
MVQDLTSIDHNTVNFMTENSKGEKVAKKCVLDETDELWLKFRFKHIAEVMTSHSKEYFSLT